MDTFKQGMLAIFSFKFLFFLLGFFFDEDTNDRIGCRLSFPQVVSDLFSNNSCKLCVPDLIDNNKRTSALCQQREKTQSGVLLKRENNTPQKEGLGFYRPNLTFFVSQCWKCRPRNKILCLCRFQIIDSKSLIINILPGLKKTSNKMATQVMAISTKKNK